MSQPHRSPRPLPRAISILALVLCVSAGGPVMAQPTVNGLFYGDGDDALYNLYSVSENGSELYSYLDASTSTLYVALVVTHDVNDMVCSPQSNQAYTQSAGWIPPRPCNQASDSEFAEFTLECEPGSTTNAWTWQQALGCSTSTLANGAPSDWISDSTCGPSTQDPTLWPPGVESNSTTSWVMNVNTYQDATTARSWDLYTFGTALGSWKSPFVSSAPDDVTQVPGYNTYSGSNTEWEWSMVYEWSVDLGPLGTDCGDQSIFFISGGSHHSPAKNGDENDTFTPPDDPFSDWGDLPDTYATLDASGGPFHHITVDGPYLGADIQAELDGQPSADATGDGPEEDGVTANVTSDWTVGSTQSFDVEVSNAPSGALLGAWIDWNGDGDFVDDPDEFYTLSVVNGTNTLNVTVGSGFDWANDPLYTRFRLFSSGAAAPGGSLDASDFGGEATDGEVEDWLFVEGTLPVTLNAFTTEGAAGGEVTARWQTASETDNVAFELWGRVGGEWRPLTDLIQSQGGSSALPQSYEVRVSAPPGLTALQLVDYDSRGRTERFGSFRVGESYGEFQPVRKIDWSGPRAERAERLRERGFADTRRSTGEAARPRKRPAGRSSVTGSP